MLKRTSGLVSGLLLASALGLQGCYGQFGLTKKIYDWNGSLGDKWVNSVVLVGLNIIPVYGFAMLADGVVLNAVEFWTGKHPMAMGESEKQIQVATLGGREFVLTATQNRIDVVPSNGGIAPVTLRYLPEESAWYAEYEGESVKVAEQEADKLTLLLPDGGEKVLTR